MINYFQLLFLVLLFLLRVSGFAQINSYQNDSSQNMNYQTPMTTPMENSPNLNHLSNSGNDNSILISSPDKARICLDPITIKATAKPSGGVFSWAVDKPGLIIEESSIQGVVKLTLEERENYIITLTYTTDSAYKSKQIRINSKYHLEQSINFYNVFNQKSEKRTGLAWELFGLYLANCLNITTYTSDDPEVSLDNAGAIVVSDNKIKSKMVLRHSALANELINSVEKTKTWSTGNPLFWNLDESSLLGKALGTSKYAYVITGLSKCLVDDHLGIELKADWKIYDELDWRSFSEFEHHSAGSVAEGIFDLVFDKALDCEYIFKANYKVNPYFKYKPLDQ